MRREDNGALHSWKEIAAHLGVSLRTAQVWEVERNLPIHRLPGGRRGQVIAYVAELDAWRRTVPDPEVRKSWRLWALGAAAGALATALIAWPDRTQPATAVLKDGQLVVSSNRGTEIFRKVLPPGSDSMYKEAGNARHRISWAGDLDGDGNAEVLFLSRRPDALGELVCFEADGREKWRYRPSHRVAARGEKFTPDWYVQNFVVGPAGSDGRHRIVAGNFQHPYYPASVALLSPEGKTEREYFHSGHLNTLEVLSGASPGSWRILAGGVNNAERCAELVILDPARMGGASVERRSEYQLLGFAPGEEEARVLFPRTLLARARDFYGVVTRIEPQGSSLRVHVLDPLPGHLPDSHFVLAIPPRLQSTGLGDGFRIAAHQLAGEGVLKGPVDFEAEKARLEREGIEVFTSRELMQLSAVGRR